MKKRGKREDDVLTVDEIKSRYDSEWILLANPEVNAHSEVVSGRLVFHSKDRDEVYQKAIDLRLPHAAFLYTGGIPEGTAVVL